MINTSKYFVNTVNNASADERYHKVVEHVTNTNNDSNLTSIQTDVSFSSLGAELQGIIENNKDTLENIIDNIEGKTSATTYFDNSIDRMRVDADYVMEAANNG